jgi:hypothetical protein
MKVDNLKKLATAMARVIDGSTKIDGLFELQKTAFEKRKEDGGEKALVAIGDAILKFLDAGLGSAGKEVVGLYKERLKAVKEVQGESSVKAIEAGGDGVRAIDGKIREAVARVKGKLTVQ